MIDVTCKSSKKLFSILVGITNVFIWLRSALQIEQGKDGGLGVR